MILGFDCDGVLADFNTNFINRCIRVTGRDLFPSRPFDIPTWNYPEHYGYTAAEVSATWNDIKKDPWFWTTLSDYAETQEAIRRIWNLQDGGHTIYFVTNRMGANPKLQTEMWLRDRRFSCPTVLISAKKGMCAEALNLGAYLDDKWENAMNVAGHWQFDLSGESLYWIPSKTRSYLLTRPWNVERNEAEYGITRVSSVLEFLDVVTA